MPICFSSNFILKREQYIVFSNQNVLSWFRECSGQHGFPSFRPIKFDSSGVFQYYSTVPAPIYHTQTPLAAIFQGQEIDKNHASKRGTKHYGLKQSWLDQ